MKSGAGRLLMALVLLAVSGSAVAQAQQYPNKPIRVVYPYAAGGGSYTLFMALAEFMSQDLGQRVLVEAKVGGNGIVGIDSVAKAPADGYTLLATFDMDLVKPHLYRNLPFDIRKDLIPISGLAETPYALGVGPSMPANNMKELAAIAKTKPGQVSYGSFGDESLPNLATAVFSKQLDIKLKQIPYRNSAAAFADINGGIVDMMLASVAAVMPHVRPGASRAIAVIGKTRDSRFPDVPTFAEQGVTGLEQPSWIGLYGPANVPKPIVDRIHLSVAKALDNAEFRTKQLEPVGWRALKLNPTELAAVQEADDRRWGGVIRELGIPMQ